MNQQCKVCGEPAAGFHFGAFTCEGCKSFFGRTYNNLGSISECKNNGECVINKKNRTACKACRLRKCLLVGMSKSGSRYGRRSNWFKIHCLLQEQQQQAANNIVAAASLRPPPYLPLFRPHTIPTDNRSSASDSGASSADPEDDLRSQSALSNRKPSASPSSDRDYFSGSSSKKLPSPASEQDFGNRLGHSLVQLPPISPNSLSLLPPTGLIPRWLPPFHGIGDPGAWKDLWMRPPITIAAPAPDQDQPIDLSVRPKDALGKVQSCEGSLGAPIMNTKVDLDEPVKSVPLDLTLDR